MTENDQVKNAACLDAHRNAREVAIVPKHDVFWVNRRGAVLSDCAPHPRWEAWSLASLADAVTA